MASAPPKKEPRPDPILPPPLAENGGSYAPTPGGPLTTERLGDLGVVKMNDYLVNGTRQQFWDEFFVKVIMQVNYFCEDQVVVFFYSCNRAFCTGCQKQGD